MPSYSLNPAPSGIDRIMVTARGNPRARSTWSGTPLSLTEAFERRGIQVYARSMANDGALARYLSASWAVPRFGYKGRNFFSFLWPRYHVGRRGMAKWRRENPDVPVLHTDTMWLPYHGMGRHDFLYRDATWNALETGWGVPPKFAKTLEERHKAIYQQVGGIFTTAQWVRNELIDRYDVEPERVISVGTGCGLITPYNGRKDYTNGKTLFVAKVRFEQKGGYLLLEAFAEAKRENPDLTLTVLVPPDVNVVADGVTVLHQVSWEKLQSLYHDASLFAMPALWEPWGMVYIEAQLNRMPILGLNRYAFAELSDHGALGFISDDESVHSIATALLKAHTNPDQLAGMGRQAQSHAMKNHSWDRTTDLILSRLLNDN